jgi:hypothetical protein
MNLDLNVDDLGVFGMGQDEVGSFSIRGHLDNNSNLMQFNKEYMGQHTVQYSGQVIKNPQNWIVNGWW